MATLQTVDVLVSDSPIKKFAHEGKTYVEARDGTEYSIRIKNNSNQRVLAICSVDGLNIIDGSKASRDGTGYIIEGYGSYIVKGFRTSNEEVNAFKFARKDKSYAAKSEDNNGDTSNCGIIGVAFIEEKIDWPSVWSNYPYDYKQWPPQFVPSNPFLYRSITACGDIPGPTYTCSSRGMSAGPIAAAPSNPEPVYLANTFQAGTAFSDKTITDNVSTAEFKRGLELETVEIYYAFRSDLETIGVKLDKAPSVNFPKSFPSAFCKPPRR